MRENREAWGPDQPGLEGLLGNDVPWRFWTPEALRSIGGAARCAMPPLPGRGASLYGAIEAWGPLLPLFHFHLGWPRVNLGLARWAAMDFEPMGDPTLGFIRRQWGGGLASFVLWSAETSGAPEPSVLDRGLLSRLRRAAEREDVASPAGLHLENHWSLSAGGHWWGPMEQPSEGGASDEYDLRRTRDGAIDLILPTYRGWYRVLTRTGDALPPQASGRSWRVSVTIAPIGYLGDFRRSRVSGRWFLGRHHAHSLGISTADR